MSGKDFATELSLRTGLSQVKAKKVIYEFWDIVEQVIKKEESINFQGIGTLKPRQQTTRVVRNPQNGEEMMFKPRTTVAFKPSSFLLKRLNNNK